MAKNAWYVPNWSIMVKHDYEPGMVSSKEWMATMINSDSVMVKALSIKHGRNLGIYHGI